jgi:CheY-like chemotaxis protein
MEVHNVTPQGGQKTMASTKLTWETFRLPVTAAPFGIGTGNNMPPHVLIVDDDIHARIILGTLVRRMGCEVIEASNANEALAILLDENAPFAIDLVITDVWMPGIDGLALLRTLREKLPSLPVAMVSARATLNSSLEAINNGAYAYLTKPFRAEEVQAVVERGLERGQEARARHELLAQFSQLAQLEGSFGDIQGQTAITDNDMIGELISGLKHELGNIVSAIILNLEMLKRSPNIPAAMSENLNDLEASANDLARLLSRFKEYPQTPTPVSYTHLRAHET